MSLQKQNPHDEGDLESYRSFGSSGSSPKEPPTGNAIRFPNALNRQTLLQIPWADGVVTMMRVVKSVIMGRGIA